MKVREFFVIEHETRGVFVGFNEEKPRFRYSILRSEGRKFYSLAEAVEMLDRLKLIWPRGKYPYIIKMPSGKVIHV